MLPGSNSTVVIEHLAQTRGSHGDKQDGQPDETHGPQPSLISRPSRGNLWRIIVDGDFSEVTKNPSEWRVTDNRGEVYNVLRATFRPPIEKLGETAHTLIFAELVGEADNEGVRV